MSRIVPQGPDKPKGAVPKDRPLRLTGVMD
jgi:hypothetical protein